MPVAAQHVLAQPALDHGTEEAGGSEDLSSGLVNKPKLVNSAVLEYSVIEHREVALTALIGSFMINGIFIILNHGVFIF